MKKRLIIVLLLGVLLTGCGGAEVLYRKVELPSAKPSLVRINSERDGFSYLVDKNTGVVYLEYDGLYRHAITVMLNRDGTPVTIEQLGFTFKEEQNED